jgi:DNA invertase Pin-like site-specific DNA recombinase
VNSVKPKNIAYLRVSTVDQDTEKNKTDILKLANEKDFGKVVFVEGYQELERKKAERDR